MSNTQPNAWTAGRPRNSNSTSRTPQARSGTQSPAQQVAPSQPPIPRSQQPAGQPSNVWTQRNSNTNSTNSSNGPAKVEPSISGEELHKSVSGFNAIEVRGFLSRDNGRIPPYRPIEADARSGSAWGHKPSHMANNQPFFLHLAKQVAAAHDGG